MSKIVFYNANNDETKAPSMHYNSENKALIIKATAYTLKCAADRPYVYLRDSAGNTLAELFVLSSIHTLTGRDDTVRIGDWTVRAEGETVVLELSTESSVWKRKVYRFRCEEDRLTYEIDLEGNGQITEAVYFGGYYSGHVRWGSGFFWSGHQFLQGFNPEPTVKEEYTFAPSSGSVIDLFGVPLPGKASWFYTPPPFCFGFQTKSTWLSMGVEAKPGENRFSDYQYRGQQEGFCLSLAYEGYTAVDGTYTMPAIGIDFAADEYEALKRHVDSLRKQDYVPTTSTRYHRVWWYEPIYCGWGSQCYIASLDKSHAPSHARQNLYEGFLKALEEHDVQPGIVVLDDKWQATYGNNDADRNKWPDIEGFIAAQHKAGRKVLLWLKAWDPEGLPAEECITNKIGLPLSIDPTNPACEARLRESVRLMLSKDGYDADGFKIDFTARISCSPGLQMHEPLWGLELMKRYLGILYDEAKKVKPDALVMAHTPHPYLADVVDMIRLNDINTDHDVNRAMTHRAKVASIACPNAIIDTDNWPITNKAVWRDYVRLQPELGVSSLYYATHIDTTGEALDAEDYALIREVWAAHRARMSAEEQIHAN
ncbi:MAG: hypothetical protein SF029_02190 [bacterium]|nr:hypothetical protein [bacterium]